MKKILHGDVVFNEDFRFNGEVVVHGDFHASGIVSVNGLRVDGNIYLDSSNTDNPPYLSAMHVHCAGKIFAHNYIFKVDNLIATGGRSIENDGPVKEHAVLAD